MANSRNNACMIYDQNKSICVDTSLPVFNLLGKRYTMFILGVIGNNNTRKNFNDILNSIPGSNRTIIARRLKDLVNMGIVKRCKKKIEIGPTEPDTWILGIATSEIPAISAFNIPANTK